jgi:predicted aspartyl protease
VPELSAEACARPADPPADARFDPAVAPLIESMRVKTGHVLVHPRLSGKDVGWFILDTGAGALCLAPEVGEKLGLAVLGSVTADGVGGNVPAPLRRGGELVVGPATLSQPTWVELDLKFLEPHFGVPVAGILGYDFFARAVVAVDYATPRVEVYAPGAYPLPQGEEWERLVLDNRLPCVEATFEGDRSGIFRIDTGATGTVTFNAGAVERLGLLVGRETKPVQVGGVGGTRTIRAGELAWFELAGHRRSPLEAAFEPEPGPQDLSAHVAGTLGGGLLTPFTLVLDLPARRIAFVPRGE